jgi:hypothetical protein
MALGSSTSMQVRIMERAINRSRISPMTGMMPMTEDHPKRNPQQQHVNARSMLNWKVCDGYPFCMLVFEPFSVFWHLVPRDLEGVPFFLVSICGPFVRPDC